MTPSHEECFAVILCAKQSADERQKRYPLVGIFFRLFGVFVGTFRVILTFLTSGAAFPKCHRQERSTRRANGLLEGLRDLLCGFFLVAIWTLPGWIRRFGYRRNG